MADTCVPMRACTACRDGCDTMAGEDMGFITLATEELEGLLGSVRKRHGSLASMFTNAQCTGELYVTGFSMGETLYAVPRTRPRASKRTAYCVSLSQCRHVIPTELTCGALALLIFCPHEQVAPSHRSSRTWLTCPRTRSSCKRLSTRFSSSDHSPRQ